MGIETRSCLLTCGAIQPFVALSARVETRELGCGGGDSGHPHPSPRCCGGSVSDSSPPSPSSSSSPSRRRRLRLRLGVVPIPIVAEELRRFRPRMLSSPPASSDFRSEAGTTMRSWYVVFRGRRPGIYNNYALAKAQCDGFPFGCLSSYDSREEAEAAYLEFSPPSPSDMYQLCGPSAVGGACSSQAQSPLHRDVKTKKTAAPKMMPLICFWKDAIMVLQFFMILFLVWQSL